MAYKLIGLLGFKFFSNSEQVIADAVALKFFWYRLIHSSTQGGGNTDASRPILWIISSI